MVWVGRFNETGGGYYRQTCPKPSPAERREQLGDAYDGCWTCGSYDKGGGFDERGMPPEDRYCVCCVRRSYGEAELGDPRPWSEEDEQADEEMEEEKEEEDIRVYAVQDHKTLDDLVSGDQVQDKRGRIWVIA
jgi:hypothetical protein